MQNKKSLQLETLGSFEKAKSVMADLYQSIEPYRALIDRTLKAKGKGDVGELAWEDVPVIDKKGFYSSHPLMSLIPEKIHRDIFFFVRSSGTSNRAGNPGFFWPRLRSQAHVALDKAHNRLIETFKLKTRRTLAIVGMSLGSWSGGLQAAFNLRALSMRPEFDFTVFTPGDSQLEILEVIEKLGDHYDQMLIILCPSEIVYLELIGEKHKMKMPYEKISFLVTGEPFSEELRIGIEKKANGRSPAVLSTYSATDCGNMGSESSDLIRVRQFLHRNPRVAVEFGFRSDSIPNLFHFDEDGGYFENVNDQLVITRWQGLPLVRYNIADSVQFYSWSKLCEAIAEVDSREREGWMELSRKPNKDLIAVYGRSDQTIFLGGSNILAFMIEDVFEKSAIRKISTGAFVAWVEEIKGRQVLSWQIELKDKEQIPQGHELEKIYDDFVNLLSQVQPEFADDYKNIYQAFEKDGFKIFAFHFCKTPYLTEHPTYSSPIKRKVLIEKGPL